MNVFKYLQGRVTGGEEMEGRSWRFRKEKKIDGKKTRWKGREEERKEKGEKAPEDMGEDRIRLNMGRLPWI